MKPLLAIIVATVLTAIVTTLTPPPPPPPDQNPAQADYIDPYDGVSTYISKTFKVDIEEATRIVYHARMTAKITEKTNNEIVTPTLILAMIATESSFNPTAKSSKQAVGLMQITKSCCKTISTDVNYNINAGVNHLIHYRAKLGSMDAAIQAYNVGITTFKRGTRAAEYLKTVRTYEKTFNNLLNEQKGV